MQQSTEVAISGPIRVKALAQKLNVRADKLFEPLLLRNVSVKSLADVIPDQVAREISLEHGVALVIIRDDSTSAPLKFPEDRSPDLRPIGTGELPPTPDANAQAKDTTKLDSSSAGDLESEFLIYLRSPRFPHSRKVVDNYLAIIEWLVKNHNQARESILGYTRGHRKYFALSRNEIDLRARSANPKPVGNTELFALTTTDSATKREIVSEILKDTGFSLAAREHAVAAMKGT